MRLPQTIELSTDLHWRINYIQCCVPLILDLKIQCEYNDCFEQLRFTGESIKDILKYEK